MGGAASWTLLGPNAPLLVFRGLGALWASFCWSLQWDQVSKEELTLCP